MMTIQLMTTKDMMKMNTMMTMMVMLGAINHMRESTTFDFVILNLISYFELYIYKLMQSNSMKPVAIIAHKIVNGTTCYKVQWDNNSVLVETW